VLPWGTQVVHNTLLCAKAQQVAKIVHHVTKIAQTSKKRLIRKFFTYGNKQTGPLSHTIFISRQRTAFIHVSIPIELGPRRIKRHYANTEQAMLCYILPFGERRFHEARIPSTTRYARFKRIVAFRSSTETDECACDRGAAKGMK